MPKYSPITVGRVLKLTTDWELIRSLIPLAGQVAASVTIQPLDATRNVYGNPRTATGVLLSVNAPRVDSNSEALQTWELEVSVDNWQ